MKLIYKIIIRTLAYSISFQSKVRNWLIGKTITKIEVESPLLNNNSIHKNRFQDKRCYILGNAPSLLKHDLNPLVNEYVFAVNSFFMHDKITSIKPSFYVLADPAFCNIKDEIIHNWWNMLIDKTNNLNIEYFIPIQLKDTEINMRLKAEKIYFLDYSLQFDSETTRGFDITKHINGVQNVLVACIQLAIYMGFNEIYLIGADHNWLSHYGEEKHFYNSKDLKLAESTNAFKNPYHWWLDAVHEMFRQYKEVNIYANKVGVKIYNASEEGVLDIFPLITYKESLTKKN